MNITNSIKLHPVLTYFVLTFILSWVCVGILFAVAPAGLEGGKAQAGGLSMLALLAMTTGPSIASIVSTSIVEGRDGLRALFSRLGRWQVNIRWYGIALFITPLLLTVILSTLAYLVSPVFVPSIITTGDIATLVGFGIILGLWAGFFEELGWSGFAVPKLQSRFSALATALIVGVMWGFWHFLGDLWGRAAVYGALFVPNFLLFVIAVTAYRILMTWVYNNSRSLLLAILMHASFSGSQFIFASSISSVVDNVLWLAIFAAVLWVVAAVVIATTGAKRLVREPRQTM